VKHALAALLLIALTAACTSGANEPSSDTSVSRDPSSRGPYAVGVTRVVFERQDRDGTPRPLDTWIWYPAEGAVSTAVMDDAPAAKSGGPFPLVIFSHGSGGQPNSQTFLTEHLASWGYVVAAPPHLGNTSDDCVICGIDVIIRSAGQRLDDVPFVLDEMLALRDGDHPLGAIIDGERTAIAGHSFGGWTTIFVAADGRFNAAIALAPGQPLLALEPARKVSVPLLIIAGEKDEIVNPDDVRTLRDAIPPATPLTYVSYPEGRHLTFIDNCLGCTEALTEARGHELTLRYATAFLQVHLAGDAGYVRYLEDIVPDAVVERRD
jgi:predicted dienelactone hydrolase